MTDTLFLLNQGTKPGLSSNCFLFNGRLSAYIAERCLFLCIWMEYIFSILHKQKFSLFFLKVLSFLSHWRVDFMFPRWEREMLNSGGENRMSFLNSRKAKRVLSAFYFWKMASTLQEMGGIQDFVPRNFFFFPQNSDSVGRKWFSFPWNFFFVRRNFYFLGRFFDYKPLFLHESAQFSSERRDIPKKTSRFPAKTSRSCEISKLWESIFSDQLFWSCKWRVKLGGKMGKVFLVQKVYTSFSFLFPVSIDWTLEANEHLTIKPNISSHHTF